MRRYRTIIIRITSIIIIPAFLSSQAIPLYAAEWKLRALSPAQRRTANNTGNPTIIEEEMAGEMKDPAPAAMRTNVMERVAANVSGEMLENYVEKATKAFNNRDAGLIDAMLAGLGQAGYKENNPAVQQLLCMKYVLLALSEDGLSERGFVNIRGWLGSIWSDRSKFLQLLVENIGETKYTQGFEALIAYIFDYRDFRNPFIKTKGTVYIDIGRVQEFLQIIRQTPEENRAATAIRLRLVALNKNIAIRSTIPVGKEHALNSVLSAIERLPGYLSMFAGGKGFIKIDLDRLNDDDRAAGVTPLHTLGTIKLNREAWANYDQAGIMRVVHHELLHRCSFSSGKDGRPIVSVKSWKQIAKVAGFVGYIRKDADGNYEFISIDGIPDDIDYKKFREISYASWVFEEADGRRMIYVNESEEHSDVKATHEVSFEAFAFVMTAYHKISVQKITDMKDYRKKSPEEFVAEVGAEYLADKDAADTAYPALSRLLKSELFDSDKFTRRRQVVVAAAPAEAKMAGPSTMLGAGKAHANAAADRNVVSRAVDMKENEADLFANRVRNVLRFMILNPHLKFSIFGQEYAFEDNWGKTCYRLGPLIFRVLKEGADISPREFPHFYKSSPEELERNVEEIVYRDKARLKEELEEEYSHRAGNIFFVSPFSAVPRIPINDHSGFMIAGMLAFRHSFKGATVIDVGSGSGLLSLVALGLGAHRAVLIEKDEIELNLARAIFKAQGWKEGENFIILKVDLEDTEKLGEEFRKLNLTRENFIGIVNIGPWQQYGEANDKALEFLSNMAEVGLIFNGGYLFEQQNHQQEYDNSAKWFESQGFSVIKEVNEVEDGEIGVLLAVKTATYPAQIGDSDQLSQPSVNSQAQDEAPGAASANSSGEVVGKKVLVITDSDAFAARVMEMHGRFKRIEIVKVSGFDSLADKEKIRAARDEFNIVETYTYFTNGISETMRLWCGEMLLTDLSDKQPDAASDALEEAV